MNTKMHRALQALDPHVLTHGRALRESHPWGRLPEVLLNYIEDYLWSRRINYSRNNRGPKTPLVRLRYLLLITYLESSDLDGLMAYHNKLPVDLWVAHRPSPTMKTCAYASMTLATLFHKVRMPDVHILRYLLAANGVMVDSDLFRTMTFNYGEMGKWKLFRYCIEIYTTEMNLAQKYHKLRMLAPEVAALLDFTRMMHYRIYNYGKHPMDLLRRHPMPPVPYYVGAATYQTYCVRAKSISVRAYEHEYNTCTCYAEIISDLENIVKQAWHKYSRHPSIPQD